LRTFERVFVWAGGALFVIALAATACTYFIRWAQPSSAENRVSIAADAGLVTLFALHHSLFARESVKRLLVRTVPDRLLRSVYVWTASVLMLAVLVWWQPVPGTLFEVRGVRAAAHAAVQVMGVWLIARAVAKIDPLDLAGIRQATAPEALQIGGPYAWVRHPLYLGWILALFGAATMTWDRLTFAVLTTAYLVVAVPFEEQSLRRTYGEAYAAYERTVRWRIVPFVY
jgi:protein-S-isoprenylcysteine O-methyltransferase Ste14